MFMIGMLAGAVLAAAAQAPLPADIDPVSRSRLPVMKRSDLNADGQKHYDAIRGTAPDIGVTGPSAVTIYAGAEAGEHFFALNQAMRKASIGPAYFDLAALVAAWEFEQQYEWTSHEGSARTNKLDAATIDAIKFNRPVTGLAPKDAAAVEFGRALFRGNHKVSSALWTKMVGLFGRQGTMELAVVMGDYAMAAVALNAADQHLLEGRTPLLPPR